MVVRPKCHCNGCSAGDIADAGSCRMFFENGFYANKPLFVLLQD